MRGLPVQPSARPHACHSSLIHDRIGQRGQIDIGISPDLSTFYPVERHTNKRESPSSALGLGLSSGRRRREQVLGEQVYTRRTGRAPSCRPGRRGGRELCTPEGGDKTEGEFESRPALDTDGARDVGARAGGG